MTFASSLPSQIERDKIIILSHVSTTLSFEEEAVQENPSQRRDAKGMEVDLDPKPPNGREQLEKAITMDEYQKIIQGQTLCKNSMEMVVLQNHHAKVAYFHSFFIL